VAPSRRRRLADPGQRVHAAADAGVSGAARLRSLARQVADRGLSGGGDPWRRGQAVGQARLPAESAPAARLRRGDHGPPRRPGSGLDQRPQGAAGRRLLYRGSGGQLRLRAAARRARHQRPPGARQAGHRSGPQRPVFGQRGRNQAGRIAAAAGRSPARRDLVGGGHGARRADLHGGKASMRQLPAGRRLRLAAEREPCFAGEAPRAAL
jgi:hypothetical protein